MKTSSQPKQFNLTQRASMRIMLSCLIGGAFTPAYALPTGEQVKAGNASFVRDGQTLSINQSSAQAIVNWQSFGIAADEAVNLYQPNQGVALFRVVGSDPSQIFGSLTATGSLFLINPNGILFAPGARVDVGNLVASTLQMSDQDFLAKRYQFNGDSTASVINKGTIRAEDGGYIVLLGNTVENSGSLTANKGSVVMGSAQSAVLDFYGDGLVQVKLSGDALNAVVNNTGNITADGGAIQLATNARTSAINVSGVVQANSLVERNGVIRLEGGANSTVLTSGKLDSRGESTGTKGGYIAVTGERVGLLDGTSIDASGNAGGGTALIGGDFQGKNANIQNADRTYVANGVSITADALDSGDGGKVVVWANDITRYYGNISAKSGFDAGNGGFVEVSGKNYLGFNGFVDTSSSNGLAGTLLLDPTNITISTGVNSIESSGATIFQETTPTATSILNTTTLQTALASNNVVVTTASAAASAGTITVANAVTWASGNSLTLTANSTIAINAAITTGTAASALILNATGNVTQSGAGIIGGAGGLTQIGVGTATLSLANTYTGATTIGAGSTLALNAAGTIAASSGVANAGNFSIAAAKTIDSMTGAGTTALGANTLTIGDASNTSSTYTGVISGTGGLIKAGAGTLTLGGANTYTGATNINAGTLQLAGGAAIADTSAVTLANVAGATLDLNGTNETIGSLAGGGATGGSVTLGSATLTAGGNNTATTYTGVISGTGGLTKTGTGVMTLSGSNAYTGATTINAGALTLGAANRIADTSTLTVASGATFNLNNFSETVGSIAGAGNITLGSAILTAGGDNTSTTYSGIANGTGGLIKTGTGMLTLSGANTYTGLTTVSAGTLKYGANNALSSGALTVSGGTFDVGTFADTIGAVTLTSGNITGTTGVLTGTSYAMQSGTVSVILGGAGVLTKTTAGTVTLSGANTYTGATNINAGTLQLAGGAAIADTSAVTLANVAGATLDLNNTNETIGSLAGGGATGGNVTLGTATLTAGGNNTATTYSGVVGGTGGLTKAGTGVMTLGGVNTYSGATTINAGTLALNATSTIATSSGVANAGNFTIAAAKTIDSMTGAGTAALGGILTIGDASNTSSTYTGIASGTGGINTAGTGTLSLGGINTYTGATTIGAGSTLALNAAGTIAASSGVANAGNFTIAGAKTIDSMTGIGTTALGANILTIGDASNTSSTYSGVISGTGGITKAGTGTLTLSGANAYSGATTISAGILSANTLANGGAASSIGASTNAAGNLVLGGGTLQYTGGTLSTDRNYTLTAGTTSSINVSTAATNLTMSGASTATTGALTKLGGGTLTLGGVNTYTGATTISAGTLALNATGTIAASSGVANGSNFTIAAAKTIDSMTGAGTTGLGANTLTIGDASNTSSAYNGVISGTGGIIKTGTGTLTLSGANSYTGATTISAGTLSAANANALGGTGTGTTVTSGATLNVNNVTLAAEALTLNGTGVGAAGALTGTGTAVVAGTVTNASASSMGTTSTASTLTLNGVVTAATNLGIVGTGDITASNAANNFSTVNINGAKNVSLRDTNAITLGNGASNLTGNLTVQAGGNITVANNIATTGGNITLAGSNFINTAGASALSASGRWLVYSATPGSDTFGGLLSGNQAIWNTAYPTAISQTGNRYVFTNNPTLTVTSTNQSKTYGQDGAPTVANAYSVTGFVNAATFGSVFTQDTAANTVSGSATSTGSSVTANVASYAIDVTPVTASTGYTLTKNSTGLLTVNPAALTVTANNQTKTYGQTFNFAGTEFTSSGLQNGETIGSATLASSGAVNTANVVGSPYAITGSNATGGTFNAGNYTITYVNGAMTVNPAIVNISGSRSYDGTTAFNATSFGTVNGVLGQTLNLSGAGSVASANAGAAQAVSLDSLALTNGTGLASNYTLTGGTYTGTISKANITVSTTDVTKTYDGTTSALGIATVTSGTLFNNASNGGTLDSLSGGTYAYTDKNAGTANKTVTVGAVTVSDGNSGGNYQVTYADNTSSTINKADITDVTGITAGNKTYDGNTAATLNTGAAGFTGIIAGENLTVGTATGSFNSKDVLTANTVNINGISLADNGSSLASNYNLTNSTASAAANITPRALTVTADAGQTKAFGSADPASFTYATGGLGLISGDNLTGFLIRNAGEVTGNYAINQGSLAAGSNYTLTYIGNNFTILAPSTSPRIEAGLVDLNPALGNYTSQQLFVLNVDATAAGNNPDSSNQSNLSTCEQKAEPLAKDKDFALMLNFGLNLPKGISTTCI